MVNINRMWFWITFHIVWLRAVYKVVMMFQINLPYLIVLFITRTIITSIGYHRYFAHQSYKTSRSFQFILGSLCWLNAQGSPLWWAKIHKIHHRFCETDQDPHNYNRGFFYAHIGWLLTDKYFTMPADSQRYIAHLHFRDFPELRVLDSSWYGIFLNILAGSIAYLIHPLGLSMLVATYGIHLHQTWCINSLNHSPYFTKTPIRLTQCDAKDGPCLYNVQNGGEGWHNHHHGNPKCAKNGPYGWRNIDYNYWAICILELTGIVWDVNHPIKKKMGSSIQQ